MKKLLVLSAVIALSFQSFAYDPVNEKLIKSFKSTFPNAAHVTWQELPKSYVVTFKEDNILERAYYDREGNITQLIRYYREAQLPFAIQHTIKKQYSGKIIYGIVEVTAVAADKSTEISYYVKLEDGRNWITVKVNGNGNSSVTQRLRKG
jgi:hypothetical protein